MIEYLFRGYDAMGRKGWVYGDLVHNQKVTKTGLEPRVMVGGYEVFKDSVGVFTGLHDKSGNRIFSGDIVKTIFDKIPFGYIEWHKDGYFYINEFNDDCDGFFPLGRMVNMIIDGKSLEIEVIGNIFESDREYDKQRNS